MVVVRFNRENLQGKGGPKEWLIPKDVKQVLGGPPVTRGESAENFWALMFGLAGEFEPATLFDWIEIHSLACGIWEGLRLSWMKTRMLDNASPEAVARLVHICSEAIAAWQGQPLIDKEDRHAGVAWLMGGEGGKKVKADLEQAGFDDASIEAEAFYLRRAIYEALERMSISVSNKKYRALEHLERRQQARSESAGGRRQAAER